MVDEKNHKARSLPGVLIVAAVIFIVVAGGSFLAGYSNRPVNKPEPAKSKAGVTIAPKTITPTEKISPAEESPTEEPTNEPEPTATLTIATPTNTPVPRITFQLKSPLEIIPSPTPTLFLNKNIFKKISLP